MASADDGYSTQPGREEVLRLGVKVVEERANRHAPIHSPLAKS